MKQKSTRSLVLAFFILALVVTVVAAFFFPHLTNFWKVSLGVTGFLFVVFLFQERRSISGSFADRNKRFGLNALFTSVVFFLIVLFLNLIAKEYDWKKDLTKNQGNSLSEQSKKVVKELADEITIKAFLDSGTKPQYAEFLNRYIYETKKLKVEYFSIDRDPQYTRENKIKPGGGFILEGKNRTARIDNLTGPDDAKLEEKFTNAIIEVTKGTKRTIYFLTGHGEHTPSNSEQEGYSQIKETLSEGRYNVQELVLIQTGKVPEDADVLIMAGPKAEIMPNEYKLMEEYLAKGGKLLLLLESDSPASIRSFASKYGVDVNLKKTIYEANPLQQIVNSPLVPVVVQYDATHDITKPLPQGQVTFYPVAVPLDKSKTPPEGMKITKLFSTSPNSFEVDFPLGKNVKIDKDTKRGPFHLALAVSNEKDDEPPKDPTAPKEKENKAKSMRLVVVGDSDFPANGAVKFYLNGDMFQNMLSWLSHEEDLISIRPKATDNRNFELTEARQRVIGAFSIFLLPVIFLSTAIWTSISRRKR